MIDMYMSCTVPYVIELARRIDREVRTVACVQSTHRAPCSPHPHPPCVQVPGGVKWIEEFLPPDEYDGYARIREAVTTTMLTTGEHEYTRYGYRLLLERKTVDVLQPDIT